MHFSSIAAKFPARFRFFYLSINFFRRRTPTLACSMQLPEIARAESTPVPATGFSPPVPVPLLTLGRCRSSNFRSRVGITCLLPHTISVAYVKYRIFIWSVQSFYAFTEHSWKQRLSQWLVTALQQRSPCDRFRLRPVPGIGVCEVMVWLYHFPPCSLLSCNVKPARFATTSPFF